MTRDPSFKETVRTAYVETTGEKFTDQKLATAAHVSVNTVRNLWHGAIPELSTLIAISNATGLSVLDVLVALQGIRRVDSAADVAAAIREQTAMLERVLLDTKKPPPSRGRKRRGPTGGRVIRGFGS